MSLRTAKPDLAVAHLSRKQHGAWSRAQAIDRAMTPKMIRVRIDRGDWSILDNSVYGHIAAPSTWERSVMAAILAEPWAVASHRSGAVLHDLVGFRQGRPEISIAPAANARGRLAIAHRGVDVRTTRIRAIPTVTVDQVFVDLAQVVSERKIRAALGARAELTPHVLDGVRDRYCELAPKGGRNLRALRSVLLRFGAGDLPAPSELEGRLASVLSLPTIPSISWEAPFPGRRPGAQRVDGLIGPWAVVIEGDGRAWHTRVEDFERDRRRDAEAAAAGYLTLRFTWHQLVTDPSWVQRIVLDTGSLRRSAA
jgi:hypothetical protein